MTKHTILIVDDDTLILNTLKKRFQSRDIEAFAASTPDEAKRLLDRLVPEVLILDLLLTSEDGSSGILDYIKSQERLHNVPIIVLTNLDKPELKRMLLGQGVKEYLIKGSMTIDELYEKVVGYLEPKGSAK